MCKSCQSCLETIWWHLIEKRFCYDESIALYEVPEKDEKNNNMFENTAFFDSVSVIAGRAVVTISPLPKELPDSVILQQPRASSVLPNSHEWQDRVSMDRSISMSAPDIIEKHVKEDIPVDVDLANSAQDLPIRPILTGTKSALDVMKLKKNSLETVQSADDLTSKVVNESLLSLPLESLRKKSLIERRMSKSLYLKIECVGDYCREIPIIRQKSMPKFYLGAPEDHQIETPIFRTPSTVLTTPVPAKTRDGFVYDLSSVVQMEKERAFNSTNFAQLPETSGRRQFRDKIIKLRRIKSTMSAFQTHHM